MCEPTTLAIAATALSVAGTAYSGYSAYQQGRYENQVARNNAAMERNAAYDAEVRGQQDELKRWRQVAATRSAQVAAFAANGFDTSFGSPVDVTGDTLQLGFEDTNAIRENASREARGYLISAQNYEQQGMAAARQGRQAVVGSIFEAGGTILGGASQVRGYQTANSRTVGGFGRSSMTGSSLPNSAFKW